MSDDSKTEELEKRVKALEDRLARTASVINKIFDDLFVYFGLKYETTETGAKIVRRE